VGELLVSILDRHTNPGTATLSHYPSDGIRLRRSPSWTFHCPERECRQEPLSVAFPPTPLARSGNISIASNATASPLAHVLTRNGRGLTFCLERIPQLESFGKVNVGSHQFVDRHADEMQLQTSDFQCDGHGRGIQSPHGSLPTRFLTPNQSSAAEYWPLRQPLP